MNRRSQNEQYGNKKFLKKLGLSRDAKYLIIHGDDLGLCTSQNEASIKAMQTGTVTSGSIMPNCGGFHEFMNHANSHPQMDLGVHLTLTSEWSNYKWSPLLPRSEVSSLVDHRGFFLGEDCFDTYDIQEVENELRAQINTVLQGGVKPTHLDCHMFCLYRCPAFMELYLKLSRQYNIPPLLNENYFQYFDLDLNDYDAEGIVFTDRIYIATPEAVTNNGLNDYYMNVINDMKPGLNVLLIHMAYDDDEMKAITEGIADWGAAWRQADFDFFTSNKCKKSIQENNIIPVTWEEIVRLMNG